MAAKKHSLRRTLRRKRGTISPDFAVIAAEQAAVRLLARPELDGATLVGVYAAMRTELDSGPLIAGLLERGVALAFPRVVRGQRRLAFHRVTDPTALAIGSFDIPEPDPTDPVVPVGRIDAFVVPGLGFDRDGWRLGWGMGHYDITLADAPRALRVGYCYDAQLLESIPADEHDLPMHLIVTETSVYEATRWTPSVS